MRLAAVGAALLLSAPLVVSAEEDVPAWKRIYGVVAVGRAKEAHDFLSTSRMEEIADDVDAAATLMIVCAQAVALNVADDSAQLDPLLPFLHDLAERSRLFAGIHTRADNEVGAQLGQLVAMRAIARYTTETSKRGGHAR